MKGFTFTTRRLLLTSTYKTARQQGGDTPIYSVLRSPSSVKIIIIIIIINELQDRRLIACKNLIYNNCVCACVCN